MKITYKKSGVNIEKANKLIKNAKGLINTTRVKGSMDCVGGFGGFFDPEAGYGKDPLLVASTDGVGTKLKIAQTLGKHDTIGIDLVAMCVNDLLCSGAKPLFFLDYFACGKLQDEIWAQVIKGIVKGCRAAGCALLGGETAEMPGMYSKGEYDLAGFSVGAVDRKKVIDGKKIKKGDLVLGLASNGLHSNGYSLIRKLFSKKEIKENGRALLRPTAIYVESFFEASKITEIKGAAHITGGGFRDNIPRMMPRGMKAIISKGSWTIPKIFRTIESKKAMTQEELYRTFNMGIGMAIVISPGKEKKIITRLAKKTGLRSWVIGKVEKGKRGVDLK